MSPFWSGFCEHFRNCGRNGAIFVAALAAFFGVLIVGVIFRHENLIPEFPKVLAAILIFTMIWVGVALRRARLARTRLRFPPLSDHDLRVAKSKLKNRGGGN
jgi:hypothetical protein